MKESRLLGAVLFFFIQMSFSTPTHAIVYSIVDIGTLGGSESEGHDINRFGQISGYSATTGNASGHAFIYDENGMIDISTLGGSSYGWCINDIGHIAGTYYSGSINHAFFYDGNIQQDIGTLGGASANAYDISNDGQIVGASKITGDTATHAFLYENGVMHDLGTLGGNDSHASGINNNGQITGYSRIPEAGGPTSAFIYSNGIMYGIGTLGGAESKGRAINDSGHITGNSQLSDSAFSHAFFYDGNTMLDIGTLGGTGSDGNDINNNDYIVGASLNSNGQGRAFLYKNGSMFDLCVLSNCVTEGWDFLLSANAINDNGDITGRGFINGQYHAFFITAIPIPPSVWLFGSGLLGLVGIARRKAA